MTELLAWAGGAAGLLGAVAAFARWVVRPLRRFARQLREFLSDWRGEPGRPGIPPRASVMERLEHIDWHIGNGTTVPLRQVVDHTAADLHDHLVEAGQDRRTLARVVRHIDLPEET